MGPIKLAIERPIAVLAAVLMVVMFGMVALERIPVQLAPDVRQPIIEIETSWPGAAPAEVEREIVIRQEEVLKGLEGLSRITSRSREGRGEISLEFNVGQNMDRALLLVANRLDRVSGYPDEADEPTLSTSGNEDNAIAWFILKRADGSQELMHGYGQFAEDVIEARLERVPGVGRVNVYGGSETEIRVEVDPTRLAYFGLQVTQVLDALRQANASITAGEVEEGKRRYVVRTDGELNTLERVRNVVIRSAGGLDGGLGRVTIADVAEVREDVKEPRAYIRNLGQPALAINATRDTGANVLAVVEGLREGVAELNRDFLAAEGLILAQTYDESIYIEAAVQLVQSNILIGGVLAAIVLMLFLRSWRATVVISLAIPVSVIGSFVAMAALGRSLNVISLAGIAFAVGMVVDAAIVVLENIYRHRSHGLKAAAAAFKGASQVWGAILVSALTTVMVFIPILIMELEVGQLFRDIAVAISVSVLLSLIVAITVVPALASRLFAGGKVTGDGSTAFPIPGVDHVARAFVKLINGVVAALVRSRALALTVVVAVVGGAMAAAWAALPKLEYLPEGNRNLVFGIVLPPPGYNLDTSTEIAARVEESVRPLWSQETGPEPEPGGPPKIENFFFVSFNEQAFIAATAEQPERVAELIPLLQGPVFAEPGTFGFISQPSLFGRDVGGARAVDLDISGPALEDVLEVAQRAAAKVEQHLSRADGHQMRPRPGLELGAPEVRVFPDSLRLADNGVSARELGTSIDAFNDGVRAAEVTLDGVRVDLTLAGRESQVTETQGIGQLPVVTADGRIVPAESLSDIEVTAGPLEIRRLERVRAVTLQIRPAPGLPLESAMEIIEEDIIAPLVAEGLPPGVKLGLSGTADKLEQTWQAMVADVLIALIIVYLVMAVLFESFAYPLIILVSVPVAAAGGVGGLALLNTYVTQPLDMLTLLGFVILIGIVVNNAILIVHQSLQHFRVDGLSATDAIQEATRNRVRPIFMSTLTSVFGMMPLVLFPGAGSELYRGLGSVVLGGLSLSALLTLLLIPPMMTVFMSVIEGKKANAPKVSDTSAPAPAE